VTDVTEVIAIAAVRTLHADPAAEFVVKPPAYAADFVVKAVAVAYAAADFVVKAAPAYAADFVVADETQQKSDADVDADEDC
jgi:hypothetical protein